MNFKFQISNSKPAVLLLALLAAGCRRDMFDQPSGRPLQESRFFRDDHMASRPLVANTVARGHLDDADPLHTGRIGTNFVETFPFPITRDLLERGRERFEIHCAPCHGRLGDGRGMIAQRGFPSPPSFHIDRLRAAPPGHFVDVIARGYGIMYPYGGRVAADDRWAITAYIRALQLSRNVKLTELPANERARVEGK